ncbi:alpha-L-fucosidase [Niabella ginsengisoli]|uniref:alpha-L-fucosidase n=1 Tax=Niabella ginsengisoli TaxID=522298 RepID=A0ABS9SEK3_9BACT|nr:alpha-L-fucosidase [Niabella ginsengisoli]MCH5596789.1 alpha-L-fucosidase [Niabella ginsengisoli]
MRKTIVSILLVFSITITYAQYQPTWQSLDARPIPKWFTDAKFGIFIHWGLYSVPAWATNSNADGFGSNYSEWYWERLNNKKLKIHKEFVDFHNKNFGPQFHYQDFASMFKAELFDPEKWAKIFKDAGAKYVVLTSKHHDGFALWPSRESWNWNAADAGPHRDLAGDLSEAVKKTGLHMGFYYSLYEWYNPLYKQDVKKYVDEHMLPQMRDLVTRYKPDIIWPDGEWDQSDTTWRSREFLTWLYNESAVKNTVVTNDRWGGGRNHGGFNTTEYGSGNASLARPWEECRGIGESFGYNRNENLEQYQTSKQLIHMLIDIVSRGGNLLLNIGPAADGTIPVIMQQRLKDMGDWLTINGDAIYGTTAWKESPKQKDTTTFYTRKGNDLYVFVTEWKKQISIPGVMAKNVTLLGYNGKVNFSKKANNIAITAPNLVPGEHSGKDAWVYKITNAF